MAGWIQRFIPFQKNSTALKVRMGINFQGVSSFMALLALQNFGEKIAVFRGGGKNGFLLCTGGSGPHGRPEVVSLYGR